MKTEETCFLGSNMKYLRELDELSKTDLSKVLRISPTEVGQLERGEIPKPSYQVVEAIADYFGVDVKEVVRSNLIGIGLSLDRSINRLLIAADGLNDPMTSVALRDLVKSYQKGLTENQHYSVKRRSFSNQQRRRIHAVPE